MKNLNGRTGRWETGLKLLGCLGAALFLAACGGGGGGGSVAGDGTLRVALTDAPSCGYDHVYVTVEKVRVHQSGTAADSDGNWREIVLSPARRIDLLSLTNGVLEELGTAPLPTGRYSQLRLVLAENGGSSPLANAVQPTGGAVVALATPSAQQSGLKLQAHFDVAAGQMADLVLDFDACKSVVKRGNSGQYNLKPVISVLQRLNTGIQGYVTTTLALSSTTVSAQQNGAVIRATVPDASGKFMLPFLAQGSYTLVVTSDGRSSAVVTNVPVGTTATTVINGTATSIALPLSTMREVTGTVSATAGTASVATLLADARVRALQLLTGGPTVEIGNTAVDADLASYRLRLPVAAPVRAAFSAGAMSAFSTEAASAGKYTVQAQAPGRTALERTVDLGAADASISFIFSP